MTKQEIQSEALFRAKYGRTWSNYPDIFKGFLDKGIPESDIKPRENIFTFNAWKAQGRTVKKGEHGVKIVTWIPIEDKPRSEAEAEAVKSMDPIDRPKHCRPRTATVFHVSQTKPLGS